MSRFATAARALRGPFKKLVHKLELRARRVVIKVSRKAAGRHADTVKHAEAAFKAARADAARLRTELVKPPTATSAAVDRTTGRVVGIGHSKHATAIPAELMAKLPDPPLEKRWEVTNCGEVEAAANAMAAASRFEDLVIRTVRTESGVEFEPCLNCDSWLPGRD
jgi:deoxycytidylate deaminase